MVQVTLDRYRMFEVPFLWFTILGECMCLFLIMAFNVPYLTVYVQVYQLKTYFQSVT